MDGKRIIISGGTTGVGAAAARLLAAEGAHVFIFGRRAERLHATLDAIRSGGGRADGVIADVSNYENLRTVFTQAETELGGFDALINNAAIPANNIFNTPEEHWDKVLRINLLGYMHCARLAAESMRKTGGGQIINIGSLCIRVLDGGCDLYVASKTGVAGFTASLRKEVADWNITVTLINPGQIASEMVTENAQEKTLAVDGGRMLRPDDIAEAIRFSLSLPSHVALQEMELVPLAQRGL